MHFTRKRLAYRDRLISAEMDRHRLRLAEINKISQALPLLEDVIQELNKRGLALMDNTHRCHLFRVPRITLAPLNGNDNRLYDALIDMGFAEEDRYTFSLVGENSYSTVKLTRSPLSISLCISAEHGQQAHQEVA